MPRNVAARARRNRTPGVRLGRPPRPDSGDWEKFYVVLRRDVSSYVRNVSAERRNSLSKVIGDLVEEGIAARLAREQTSEQTL